VPLAVTENVTVAPGAAVWLAGWVVTVGATAAALTFSVAVLLVTLPLELLTTTSKLEPSSEELVAGVV